MTAGPSGVNETLSAWRFRPFASKTRELCGFSALFTGRRFSAHGTWRNSEQVKPLAMSAGRLDLKCYLSKDPFLRMGVSPILALRGGS